MKAQVLLSPEGCDEFARPGFNFHHADVGFGRVGKYGPYHKFGVTMFEVMLDDCGEQRISYEFKGYHDLTNEVAQLLVENAADVRLNGAPKLSELEPQTSI